MTAFLILVLVLTGIRLFCAFLVMLAGIATPIQLAVDTLMNVPVGAWAIYLLMEQVG